MVGGRCVSVLGVGRMGKPIKMLKQAICSCALFHAACRWNRIFAPRSGNG
ncbi:hypothetical protein CPter291_2306 [Collimonas pratensis]|uniref:Uncharacterized protein n=1 Tax=Collimonas pratensis TaxID=279113 RepID=A0ABM5Z5Z3_9BURK|nr:hypothetical protein CPter291_2306 [Collimonas pratensis]